jgi:hypothetical protein
MDGGDLLLKCFVGDWQHTASEQPRSIDYVFLLNFLPADVGVALQSARWIFTVARSFQTPAKSLLAIDREPAGPLVETTRGDTLS